ncbi:tetratricopeptide repeat protein [Ruegeria sp. MALMAid1280]|uniref:tetratricopeptide repeat protein n=1 Tax=Ruegeria sp. MALMAid1280 TaxID=3411634 RepID=UPI003BA383C6
MENLSNALMQIGQIEKALEYTEQNLEKHPNNKELNRVLDEIYLKGNDWRVIVEHASKRLETDPDNVSLLTRRARAHSIIGFVEGNSKDVARAYELARGDKKIAFMKSLNLHQQGDKKAPTEIFQRIFAEDPGHAASLLQMSTMAGSEDATHLLDSVEAVISNSENEISELEFAKAHLISKSQGMDVAMPQFARGNALQHDTNPYNFEEAEKRCHTITELFPDGIDAPQAGPSEIPAPILSWANPARVPR